MAHSHKSRFIDIEELLRNPPPMTWIVKNFLCANTLAIFIGEPSSGKSLVQIDLLCHVATGRPWRGCSVSTGFVFYVCGEGQAGIARRFDAWFQYHDEIPRNVKLTTVPAALTDDDAVTHIINDINTLCPEHPRLIFIDTLQRNFGSGDENSTRDMSDAVRNLDRIRVATHACIGVNHHTGKSDKATGRGSSVLKGAADVEYLLERNPHTHIITMRHAKPPKDFDPPPPLAWNITKQITTLTDEDKQPIHSVILSPVEVPIAPRKVPTLGDNQRKAFSILKSLLEERNATGVTVREWNAAMKRQGIPKNRCLEAKTALVERDLITVTALGIVTLQSLE